MQNKEIKKTLIVKQENFQELLDALNDPKKLMGYEAILVHTPDRLWLCDLDNINYEDNV